MKTLPYKTQACIYTGIFLLLVIIVVVTYFFGRKTYSKRRKVSITLFILSFLSLIGAGYEVFNIVHAMSIVKEVVSPSKDSNTRSTYFEIMGSQREYNGESYDFKTNSAGSYVLTLKGLKEGKIQLLTGKSDSFLHEFQTINVEPNEITHVVLSVAPTQPSLHLVLKDPNKTIDVVNIKNESKQYQKIVASENKLLPGQKLNSSLVKTHNSQLINKSNSAIHYTVDKNQKITKLEYYSNDILLDPEDIIFCLQNITGSKNLRFSKKRLTKNNFEVSFNQNFNFYNPKTRRWYNVEQVMTKKNKLDKFVVRLGKNTKYD